MLGSAMQNSERSVLVSRQGNSWTHIQPLDCLARKGAAFAHSWRSCRHLAEPLIKERLTAAYLLIYSILVTGRLRP